MSPGCPQTRGHPASATDVLVGLKFHSITSCCIYLPNGGSGNTEESDRIYLEIKGRNTR